jgi:hypothetical protein
MFAMNVKCQGLRSLRHQVFHVLQVAQLWYAGNRFDSWKHVKLQQFPTRARQRHLIK